MALTHLAESNLLLRWAQPSAPEHGQSVSAVTKIWTRGDSTVIVPQCVVEFWSVSSRPKQVNGFGLPLAVVQQEVQRLKQFFPLLLDLPAIHAIWEQIVAAYGVQGKQVHDARLVAAMQVHGITHILAFNTDDFLRYQPLGITAVHPGSV